MSTHAENPDHHGEAILAAYSHVASSPVAEWSYRHTELFAFVVAFLLFLSLSTPVLAAALAIGVAALMTVGAVVLALLDKRGTCVQIIAEVREREEKP